MPSWGRTAISVPTMPAAPAPSRAALQGRSSGIATRCVTTALPRAATQGRERAAATSLAEVAVGVVAAAAAHVHAHQDQAQRQHAAAREQVADLLELVAAGVVGGGHPDARAGRGEAAAR